MEPWKLIQDCKLPSGSFDKEMLIENIRDASREEVNELCDRFLNLEHHHSVTVGLYATDKKELSTDDHFQIKPLGDTDGN